MVFFFINSFFDKFIEDSFLTFNPSNTSLIASDFFIALIWSVVLSMIIATTYRGTHRGISYSQNFTQTLVILCMIVTTVMVVIGSDIARAFTLIGSMTIIRFRNAIKETRDVAFIFFIMVIGMACGSRYYLVSIILTFSCCGLLYLMEFLQFGKKEISQDILELNFSFKNKSEQQKVSTFSEVLNPIFKKYLKYYSLVSIDSIDDQQVRLNFIFTVKKKINVISIKKGRDSFESIDVKAKLMDELKSNIDISNIKIIEGENSIEI